MNLNKNIIIGLAFFAAMAALIWLGKSGSPSVEQASINQGGGTKGALISPEPYFDFGAISMAAGNVSHSFKVKNSSAVPAVVNKIYTSCMCTTAEFIRGGRAIGPFGMPGHGISGWIKETLEPGEEAEIKATFDPAAHGPAGVGKAERAIYIETKEGEAMALEFTVNVTP